MFQSTLWPCNNKKKRSLQVVSFHFKHSQPWRRLRPQTNHSFCDLFAGQSIPFSLRSSVSAQREIKTTSVILNACTSIVSVIVCRSVFIFEESRLGYVVCCYVVLITIQLYSRYLQQIDLLTVVVRPHSDFQKDQIFV